MTLPANDHLLAGRYRLGETLGSGGMADVRRAWDTRLRRHVAVKLFRPGSDVADERRFVNEVHTLAGLSHPGLVSVYDAGATDGTPFVVLQLVEGSTLRERIFNGPLPVAEVRRLGAELADALAHVHAHGVVHRDIKPSNILLDADGNAHLADFGLARLTDGTRLTNADQLVGTAAYLAPEQVRGEEIDHAVDVYALGLVLLECLTGQREYQGSEIEAAVARLHRRPAVPDDLPADLTRLLTLMTSLSARRRPTAADCAQALHQPETTRVLPRSHPSAHLLLASAVTALLAAGVITTATLNTPPPAESAPPAVTAPDLPANGAVTPVADSIGGSAPVDRAPAQANPAGQDNSGPGKSAKTKGENRGKGKGSP